MPSNSYRYRPLVVVVMVAAPARWVEVGAVWNSGSGDRSSRGYSRNRSYTPVAKRGSRLLLIYFGTVCSKDPHPGAHLAEWLAQPRRLVGIPL